MSRTGESVETLRELVVGKGRGRRREGFLSGVMEIAKIALVIVYLSVKWPRIPEFAHFLRVNSMAYEL